MQTVIQMYEVEQDNMIAQIPSEPYVMVIDDDPSILSVVSFLLDTENHPNLSVSESSSVLPFLERLLKLGIRLPSLILLDLMMPMVSGYDIAASLARHEHLSHIPILIMTADHRINEASRVKGATDLINKPFHIEILLDKIEHFVTG